MEIGTVTHWRPPPTPPLIAWPPVPPELLGAPVDYLGIIWPAGGDSPPVLRLFAADMRDGASLPDIGTEVGFSLGSRGDRPCAKDVIVLEG